MAAGKIGGMGAPAAFFVWGEDDDKMLLHDTSPHQGFDSPTICSTQCSPKDTVPRNQQRHEFSENLRAGGGHPSASGRAATPMAEYLKLSA
jgi:hypothetical protein